MATTEELNGLIKGLADVLKSQQAANSTAFQQTAEQLQTLSSTVEALSKSIAPLSPRRGGGLSLDQTGMCHQRLKFTTLFWSGNSQKVCPVLESLNLLYCIVLYWRQRPYLCFTYLIN